MPKSTLLDDTLEMFLAEKAKKWGKVRPERKLRRDVFLEMFLAVHKPQSKKIARTSRAR
jgi:hypothetical protein